MTVNHGEPCRGLSDESPVNWKVNAIQSDKFLSLLLSMVPVVCQKGQEERIKKVNGMTPIGYGFNIRTDQHLEYHNFSEPSYHGNGPHCSSLCSTNYDFDGYDYCDGIDASETDAMLQDSRTSADGDKDAPVEGSKKQTKESSIAMALQILLPFLLAGFGTVSAGMVLDIVQHWEVFKNLTEVFILVPALLGLKGNLEMTLASRLSTAVNVGKMDSPIEKWNLIIGNLALKQVQATVVGFLAAVAAVILGWIPEGKYQLDHAVLLCSSSVATAFIASLLQGIIMVGVIVGSKKTGINPDNVATPIAASFGDLITLAILAWISQGLYNCLGSYSFVSLLVGAFFLAMTPVWIVIASKHPATRTVLRSGWEPVITAMLISSIGGLILDTTVSDPNLVGIVVYTPVINGIGGNLVAIQASRISTYLHLSDQNQSGAPAPRPLW
uniref:Solute carrier family 41 member n=1 Tax=Xenopus tropicalis TaxID=8364 RepID=Q28CL5_XENTR|nr:solute carrier family 41, member 2 [Xenopus tropicalis]|eukprot:NP_001096676.1 solute carrier family 41 member 2 [Xenopus tropicalis]